MRSRHRTTAARGLAVLGLVVGSLVAAASALAHAEITPEQVAPRALTRLTLTVENERASAQTVKVVVTMPAQLIVTQFAAKPGWKRTATTRRLAVPLKVKGRTIRRHAEVVTWTATTRSARFGPGHAHGHFTFSAVARAAAGRTLLLPTVQTYSNRDVVRWIGAAGSDTPAPRVVVG